MPPLPSQQDSPIISIKGLSFAYPTYHEAATESWALNDLNLELKAGSISAIMGPAGAGKSTLAQALLGIVPQSSGGRIRGRIEVCGLDPVHTPVAEMARKVGLVFQDPESQFLTNSVRQEVAFGLESLGVPAQEMPAIIENALARLGMRPLGERSPHQLSGGQKQRVAIAAILAMQPTLLVLDEPAASLDQKGSAELRQGLKELRTRGASTIVLITNQADWVAEFADEVVILHEGRVWRQGSPGEVFSHAQDLLSIGVKPPELELLRHHLRLFTGHNFSFTSWQQAQQALSRIAADHR